MLVFMQTSAVFAALNLEDVRSWYWTDNTKIESVVKGDVDGDGQEEIVTGGYYDDGTRWGAQLCVWDGATLAVEDVINGTGQVTHSSILLLLVMLMEILTWRL